MPSPVMSSAAAALPAAIIVQSGQSSASPVADASAAVGSGDANGTAPFAALLGQQIAASALPLEVGSVGLIDAGDRSANAPADSAAPPADVSVLLQALLLPLTAQFDAAAGDPKSAAAGTPDAALAPAAVAPTVPNPANPVPVPALAVGSLEFDQDSPQLAHVVADDSAPQGAPAAVAGKPAEYAGGEPPVEPTQQDLLPAAVPMIAHHAPQADTIERERLVISTPATSPTWHQELGSKVKMLIGNEASSAELVLTPPHLGRIEVQLSVTADQTSATFVAATPAAREALEQALPKLREFLADAGINLSQASVGADAQAGHGHPGGNRGGQPGRELATGSRAEIVVGQVGLRPIDGMVDVFA